MVVVVIFGLNALLSEGSDTADQHVGEGISGAHNRIGSVEGEKAVQRPAGCAGLGTYFVLVRIDDVGAKLQVVLPDNFRDVVTIGEDRVGVINSLRNVARILRYAGENASVQRKAG